MFLLLLALLIGLVLGQFIKIELPYEAQQELIRAIKSLPGTTKIVFEQLMCELRQSQPSQLQPNLLNGKQPHQDLVEAAIEKK